MTKLLTIDLRSTAPRMLGSRGTPSQFVLHGLKNMCVKFDAFTRFVTIFPLTDRTINNLIILLILLLQLMVGGQTGHHGEPAVSHAAVDPNSAVALAPIPLPRAVENRVLDIKQSHKSAIHRAVNVSTQGNEGFSCSFRCL